MSKNNNDEIIILLRQINASVTEMAALFKDEQKINFWKIMERIGLIIGAMGLYSMVSDIIHVVARR
jgi:hypothetical protein